MGAPAFLPVYQIRKSQQQSPPPPRESPSPQLLQPEIGRTRNVSSSLKEQATLEWTNNIFLQPLFSLLTFLLGHHKSTHNIRVDPHLASLRFRNPFALFFKALDPMTVVAATLLISHCHWVT